MCERVFILVFLMGFTMGISHDVHAQEPNENEIKNSLYFTGGTFGIWVVGNVNYERLLNANDSKFIKRYYFHTDVGRFLTWGTQGFVIDAKAIGLTGQNKSHLEMGLGIALFSDPEFGTFSPSGNIGYRYMKPEGGFMFRTGVGIPEGLYVSFGWAF